MLTLTEINVLCSRIKMEIFNTVFNLKVSRDDKDLDNGRIYLQIIYSAPCSKTGKLEEWKGRKHYLSEHMTSDEVVKTAYLALELAVKHEVMEGFKIDGRPLFNPHINFEELLQISDKEIRRDNMKTSTYIIDTVMGKTRDYLGFLNTEEFNNFNNIGYTGKTIDNHKMSRFEYLNSLNKGNFNITQTRYDNGDFCETFIITRTYKE